LHPSHIPGKINELSSKEISKWADIHLNTDIDDYAVGDNFIGFVYSDGDGLLQLFHQAWHFSYSCQ